MAPRIDHYDWPGGREALLRFGPDHGPVIIALLPLFEEANRTRTFTVGLLRKLADRGIVSLLPDLPGQGESLVPLAALTGAEMTKAVAALADRCGAEGSQVYTLGIRSGALLDTQARLGGRWRFSPQTGDELLRELRRVWQAAGQRGGAEAMMSPGPDPIEIAGNRLSAQLLASFAGATPLDQPGVPRRVIRLATDPAPAARRIDAAPLWRRTEPGDDPALAALLADDIAQWLATCAA
jgi:hypothetical protein